MLLLGSKVCVELSYNETYHCLVFFPTVSAIRGVVRRDDVNGRWKETERSNIRKHVKRTIHVLFKCKPFNASIGKAAKKDYMRSRIRHVGSSSCNVDILGCIESDKRIELEQLKGSILVCWVSGEGR